MNDQEPESVSVEESDSASSHQKTFSRGIRSTSVGTAISLVFLFAEAVLAIRLISPARYGTYVLLLTAANVFVMIIDLGQRTAVAQLVASSDRDRQAALTNSLLVFRLLLLGIVCLLIMLGRHLLVMVDASGDLEQYAGYVVLMIIATSFDELTTGLLQGFHLYSHMAVNTIMRAVLRFGLTALFLGLFNLNIGGLVLSWTIAYAATSVYAFIKIPIRKSFHIDWRLTGTSIRYAMTFWFNRIMYFSSSGFTTMLLGALGGPVSVAFFSVASKIPDAFMRFIDSYVAVFYPTTTKFLAEKRQDLADEILNRSIKFTSFVLASAAIVGALFSREIVVLLFSKQYASASWAFALLMIGLQVIIMVNNLGYCLTAAGYNERALYANIAQTIVMLPLTLYLIPKLGFIGPAISGLIAYYLITPALAQMTRRVGFTVDLMPFIKQALLLVVSVVGYWYIDASGWLPSVFASIVLRIVLIIAMLAASFALKTISLDAIGFMMPTLTLQRLRVRLAGRSSE